jgi:hypothetical protein
VPAAELGKPDPGVDLVDEGLFGQGGHVAPPYAGTVLFIAVLKKDFQSESIRPWNIGMME